MWPVQDLRPSPQLLPGRSGRDAVQGRREQALSGPAEVPGREAGEASRRTADPAKRPNDAGTGCNDVPGRFSAQPDVWRIARMRISRPFSSMAKLAPQVIFGLPRRFRRFCSVKAAVESEHPPRVDPAAVAGTDLAQGQRQRHVDRQEAPAKQAELTLCVLPILWEGKVEDGLIP